MLLLNGMVRRYSASLPYELTTPCTVPSAEEIDFIIEVIEKVGDHKLNDVEKLLATTSTWDNVARNDFCRYLHAVRSVWIGLATLYKTEPITSPNNMLIPEFESPDMIVSTLDMNCGFVLTNPADPRYQKVAAYRERFGQVVKRAASLLRQGSGGEDHTDAVITVTRCIDTYLSSYGLTHGEYEALKKNYTAAREFVDFLLYWGILLTFRPG
jgi:proteasome activator subunit 4